MPFEIMIVVVVSVLAGTLGFVVVTKMIVDSIERRRLNVHADNSMTKTELSALIEAAVEDATSSLRNDLDRLQARLPAAEQAKLLDTHSEEGP